MKELLHIWFGVNALAAIFGWAAFNFIVLSLYKDENENSFNLIAYSKEHWDNWLGSLIAIPAFLFIGAKGFNFQDVGMENIKWSDAYFVLSGFGFEAAKKAYKKYLNKN